MADLPHLAQVVPDVLLAEQRDVEPQVLAEAVAGALALGDVLLHPPRYDVARRELLLLGLVVGHEPVAVDVLEQAAVAAAAFGDQDAGREDARRMELHRFHVAERRHAGFERDAAAEAFADHGIGRHAIEAAGAAARDGRGLGHVRDELAGDEVADDGAVAAARIVDQRDRLGPLVHGNRRADRLIAHRLQHGVARSVRHVAGAPLLGAPEVALGDEAVRFVALGDRHLLIVDDDGPVALAHAAPRQAPRGQLAHRLRRGVDEHPHDALVGAPVAAAHRVLEMHVLVVALALDHVAERGLHASLRGRRVRALRRHQRQDDHVVAAALGADGDAQSGEAAADDEDVGVDHVHRGVPAGTPGAAGTAGAVCRCAGT